MSKDQSRIPVTIGEPLKVDIISLDGGTVLARAGTVVTEELLAKLSNWIVEKTEESREDIHEKRKRLRREIIKKLDFQQVVSDKTRQELDKGCGDLFKRIGGKSGKKADLDVKAMKNSVEQLIDETSNDPDTPLQLFDIKEHSYEVYQHSVECGILASFIAGVLGYSEREVSDFVMGMILHDVGMMQTPKEILQKKGPLAPDEWNPVKTHPERGWDALKEVVGLSPICLMTAMGHHVYADGSGYPAQLDFNDLPPLVNLATLIDHFGALTSPRSYRPAYGMYDAVKILLLQREKYHPGALENFVKVVGIYPISSFLKLTSGETAVVVSNNPDNLFLPEVKIVLDSDGTVLSKEIIVNLKDEPDRRPVEVLEDI